MSDSEIIWKFLHNIYLDDHTAIYLYCCGNVRSPSTAINKIMEEIRIVFVPMIDEYYVKTIVKAFLDNKKKLFMKGLIKIKPLY